MKNHLIVLLVICVSALEASKFRCDYKRKGPGWFKYHEIPLKWHDARWMCYYEGGVLASPTTTAMTEVMKSCIHNTDVIFTGMHALSKGHYHSVEGIPLGKMTYEWADFEPDNENNTENCLAMHSNGKLADINCDEPRPYLCFREDSEVEVNACGTPDPEYSYEPRTKKCYKFHKNPRNFYDAHFACSAEGGRLVILNSEEEAKIIHNMIKATPEDAIVGFFHKEYLHVGFSNWGKSPETNWMTLNGQSIKDAGFAKWAPGEPNNIEREPENCGSIHRVTGLLNDLPCNSMVFTFICEKEPDYPQICDSNDEQKVITSTYTYTKY